jgi:hypothetical protein
MKYIIKNFSLIVLATVSVFSFLLFWYCFYEPELSSFGYPAFKSSGNIELAKLEHETLLITIVALFSLSLFGLVVALINKKSTRELKDVRTSS